MFLGHVAVERTLFALGVIVYARMTRALDAVERWSFAVFAGFLIPVWAGWFDRHRSLRG